MSATTRFSRSVVAVMAVAVLVVCAYAGHADTWEKVYWEDDFQDGDYTDEPSWTTFGTSTANFAVTDLGFGQYAFDLSATHTPGGAWAGAYVNVLESTAGIRGWVNTASLQSDDWVALFMLRYTPTATLGTGTGYALAIGNSVTYGMLAQLYQLNDTSAYTAVTDPLVISASYLDLRVHFDATGTGAQTAVRGRIWADGAAEPIGWHLDSNRPGSAPGITSTYNSGFGGVGVVALEDAVTGRAYFDDVSYGTPEPGTLALLVTGIGALALRRRHAG